VADDLDGFGVGEDGGESLRAGGVGEVGRKFDFDLENVSI